MAERVDSTVSNASLADEGAQQLLTKYIQGKQLTEIRLNQIYRSIVRFGKELTSRTELDSILELLDIRPLKATIISAGILGKSIPDENRGDIRIKHVCDFFAYILDRTSKTVNPIRGLVAWDQHHYHQVPSDLELSDVFKLAEKCTEVVTLLTPLLSGITVSEETDKGISSTRIYPQADAPQPVLANNNRVPVYMLSYNKILSEYINAVQEINNQTPIPILPNNSNANGRLTVTTVRRLFNRYENELEYSREMSLDEYLACEFFETCGRVYNHPEIDVLCEDISKIRETLFQETGVEYSDININGSGIKMTRAEVTGRAENPYGISILFAAVSIQNAILVKCTPRDPIPVRQAGWMNVTNVSLNTKGTLPVMLIFLGQVASYALLFVIADVTLADLLSQMKEHPTIYITVLTLSPLASPWRTLYRDYFPGF